MPKGRPDEELVGLGWAANAEEVPPVMREIARVALAQKLSSGELARRLNKLDGGKRSTKNVSAHFAVQTMPRDKTLANYAEILGIDGNHIALLRGELVGLADATELLVSGPVRYLLLKSARFKKRTVENVRLVVAEMLKDRPEDARRVASRVLLATLRQAVGLPDEVAAKYPEFAERFGLGLTAFADAVKTRVNLFEAQAHRDRRLARIWVQLGAFPLEERDSQKVIDQIVRLLKRRRVNTAQMEATLREVQSNLTEGLSIPTRVPLMSDFDV